ncbi:calcium-binding protein [Natrinema saccharevitans]|uniref:Calcium-binding protein n=2 Tax=Natrinema saccharevitans TaxID=301967 RepID=A0A1S8AXE5_9EURY|nr:calcium-binding protein [Natrinema saccharevitans]
MKKGALATSMAALGAGAMTGTGAAQDGGDGEVIVHADDYFPDTDFTVAASLNDQTRDDLLEETGAADEFDTPDDWDAYIITYDFGGTAPSMGILMTEEADLSQGDSETMGADGEFRNPELAMVEATLGASGNGGNGDDMGDDGGNGDDMGDDGGNGGDAGDDGGNGGGAGDDGGNGGGAGGDGGGAGDNETGGGN